MNPFPTRILPGVVLAVLTGATIAQPTTTPSRAVQQPADQPANAPDSTLAPQSLTIDLTDSPVATLLQALDANVRTYNEHITTLANPFFEGRAPGLRGNNLAAEYIAFHFNRVGLKPAFASEQTASEGSLVLTPLDDWFQPFSTGSTTSIASATLSAGGVGDLALDTDFAVLGFSGQDTLDNLPLVFIGYGIEDGRAGYSSFDDDTDLTGKVALVLRFEPMDESGQSLWLPGGWTPNAGLEAKFRAAEDRGAAAVILVNPTGADDDRMGKLESIRTAPMFGGPLDIPVLHLSEAAADRLIRAADERGRSLLDLRRLADEGTTIIDLPDQPVSVSVDLETKPTLTQNVGGILPGRGELASQYVVIGAHFDHVGYGYDGGSLSGSTGVLHPGADDNSSGTSGLLLAAQLMAHMYAQLPEDAGARSILFLAFSGEELGLLGSAHYVQHPIVPIDQHTFMLNMDMIGRLRAGVMELGGVRTAEGLWEFLDPKVAASGLDVKPLPGGVGPSDHTNFYNAGMPVLFLHTLLHDEYHRPGDFSWTINSVGAVRVVDLCLDIALDLATRPERFTRGAVTRPTGGRTRAYLGITGEDSDDGGVLIVSVGEDTPAQEAGLLPGDIIIGWEDETITDQAQWRPMLRERGPGDKVTITVLRDGAETILTCTLGER